MHQEAAATHGAAFVRLAHAYETDTEKREDLPHGIRNVILSRLGQSQVLESTSMSLDDLRSRLWKMQRMILARMVVAGLACLILIACGVLTFKSRTHIGVTDMRVLETFFLVCAGYWFCEVILSFRRVPKQLLTEGQPNACAAFYRSELEWQRAFHHRSAVLPPFWVSAMLLVVLLLGPPLREIMMAIWVLLVPLFDEFNFQRASRSQRELDELNVTLAP